MLFDAKIGILGKYLYISHTLFVLYLESNHTLFAEKLYFIWKLSSGNTVVFVKLYVSMPVFLSKLVFVDLELDVPMLMLLL